MHARSIALLLLLGACSRAGKPADSSPAPVERRTAARTESVRVFVDPGDADLIGPARLRELAPRIARVEGEPSEIRLRLGETYPLARIRVVAFDADGQRLGRLFMSNRRLQSPVAAMVSLDSLRANQPGEAVLTLGVPLWSESGGQGPAPQALVRIHVQ